MQILHTAWNTRRLAVISAGSQVHHMPQRYRRLLDWRNERGESRLLVRACLHGWTRGCKNYKETGSGVRRIMVYKLAQRHTFNARKQMALVVPSFKDTLGAWSLKSGLGNATIEKDSVLLIDLGSFDFVPKIAVSYIQITCHGCPSWKVRSIIGWDTWWQLSKHDIRWRDVWCGSDFVRC